MGYNRGGRGQIEKGGPNKNRGQKSKYPERAAQVARHKGGKKIGRKDRGVSIVLKEREGGGIAAGSGG